MAKCSSNNPMPLQLMTGFIILYGFLLLTVEKKCVICPKMSVWKIIKRKSLKNYIQMKTVSKLDVQTRILSMKSVKICFHGCGHFRLWEFEKVFVKPVHSFNDLGYHHSGYLPVRSRCCPPVGRTITRLREWTL